MKMEGEIISIENIQPSSPTPHDKKTHKLSLLDQIHSPVFIPLVFYYPNPNNSPLNNKNHNTQDLINSQTTQILKKSLSETLTRFYPLAGRVSENSLSVDCNDKGVLFKVARFTNNSLPDFLKKPDPIACRAHIPSEHTWAERGPGSHVAMFQLNYFRCGGVSIGSLLLHSVVDLAALCSFMKAWAAAAIHSDKNYIMQSSPEDLYAARSLFPQNESLRRENGHRRYLKQGKTVMRRYVFDGSAISRLRDEFELRPTRVELVSAIMWRCFMAACAAARGDTPSAAPVQSVVSHVVNIRGKADPPFPKSSFGNFVWLVAAGSSNNGEADRELEKLVGKVRKATRKMNGDFVRRMQGYQGFLGYCKNLQQSWNEFPENADYLFISSCCGFGLYSLDFGFGKPMWISKCDAGGDTQWLTNVLWLMDTREGGGIEAWLILDEKYVAALDKIQELHDLASVDPSYWI